MKAYVKYSDEIADEICKTISTSHYGLHKLCQLNDHWPRAQNIYEWMFAHPSFRDNYARAKANQVECLIDDALNSASDGSKDTYIDDRGNERCDHEWVQRSRLKVDTIKWLASKLAPKLYGDRNVDDDSAKKIEELKNEIESLKDIASKCLKSI